MKKKQILLLTGVVIITTLLFAFDIQQYLNLEFIKARQAELDHYYLMNPIQTGVLFFITYVIVTSLSLPGAAILTLSAGAIFGIVWGSLLSSFAAVIGATIAFLISRYLFHDYVQSRFGKHLVHINHGIRTEGSLYLFTLRMVPIFPYFMINVVMALTPIRPFTFAWVSQVGMIIPTIIFVNAGTQLAKIETPSDVLSLELILSFALLGLFPLVAKKVLVYVRKKRHESLEDFEIENDD